MALLMYFLVCLSLGYNDGSVFDFVINLFRKCSLQSGIKFKKNGILHVLSLSENKLILIHMISLFQYGIPGLSLMRTFHDQTKSINYLRWNPHEVFCRNHLESPSTFN